MDNRWTIRRVAEDARAMVEEVHGVTGIPYGLLVSDAIRGWFDLLKRDSITPPTRWTAKKS
jgi:hypothetical protein